MNIDSSLSNYNYRLSGSGNKSNTSKNNTMLILSYQQIQLDKLGEALSLILLEWKGLIMLWRV